MITFPPCGEIAQVHNIRLLCSRRKLPEHHEPVRIRKGQCTKQNAVKQTEYCCGTSDSKRQGYDHNGGKLRRTGKRAGAITDITQCLLKPRESPLAPRHFG